MIKLDVVRRFADDFKIAHHRILRFLVVQESDFVHVSKLAVDTFDRFENMFKVIRDA